MPGWNRRWTALSAGAGLLLAGTAAVLLVTDAKPELDETLLREVGPVVHAALPTDRELTWPGPLKGRWFCAERWVETRHIDGAVRVGLIANCSEYARRDGALVESAGLHSPLVVTLTPGRNGWRVHDVDVPTDGAGHDASLRRMFTQPGYEEVRRSMGEPGPDPAVEAREAFRLPVDAPVLPR
ncbi:hypothetical protein [Actinophytocola sp.]|uniref:hypothetical protein n=1 Tax=Actinophytocola sp. TaxID=1872138 RepID=UPI00389AB4F4